MTDAAAITAVFTGLATLIASIGALIVALRNTKKSDAIIAKADEIHVLANSNLTRVSAALDVANEKISGLQKLVTALAKSKKK